MISFAVIVGRTACNCEMSWRTRDRRYTVDSDTPMRFALSARRAAARTFSRVGVTFRLPLGRGARPCAGVVVPAADPDRKGRVGSSLASCPRFSFPPPPNPILGRVHDHPRRLYRDSYRVHHG